MSTAFAKARLGSSLATAAALLVFGAPGAHATQFVKPSDPMPHYERVGSGFACHQSADDYRAAEKAQRDACLRLGQLYVGMSRHDLEGMIGEPVTSVFGKGRTYFDYVLQSDMDGNAVTYLLVAYTPGDMTSVLQLTGAAWPGAWRFAGLTLGDSESALQQRLGEALAYETSDEAGTIEWSYTPWTFSFEIHDRVISSIRLSEGDPP